MCAPGKACETQPKHPQGARVALGQNSVRHAGQAGHALLLNHTADSYHWGCYATSMALYNGLLDLGYAVTAFPVELTHGIALGARSIKDLAGKTFLEAFSARHAILAQALRDADLVVINGEGTLHRDHAAPFNLLALAWLARNRFGVRVHLVNHSCFPDGATGIAAPQVEAFYEACTAACERVVVREPLSLDVYQRFGRKVALGFDSLPLFADRFSPREETSACELLVGGGVSLAGHETRAFINTLSQQTPPGARIRFLAGARRREPPEDAWFIEALRQARFDVEIFRPQTIHGWLDAVRGARLMVTGRFHHLVAAASFGTPVVTLRSNTPKSEGVCQMLGFSPPLVAGAPGFAATLADAMASARAGQGDATTPAQQQALVALAERNLPAPEATPSLSPQPETILAREADQVRQYRRQAAIAGFVNVPGWRKPVLKRFFAAAGERPFFENLEQAVASGRAGAFALWAGSAPENPPCPLLRLEDGFLRSVGLGAAGQPPVSLVLDSRGIYYDPRHSSDLEVLLQEGAFSPLDRARARALIARLVGARITKYNLDENARPLVVPPDRTVILVPGQVEDDASMRFGAPGLDTLTHLERVRARCPDAYILFKPHPDVSAGLRRGLSNEKKALGFADAVVAGYPMTALLDHVQEVHTITSLTGFEALLRGRRVVCEGVPFYAGWGLTEDMAHEHPALARRTRRLSLSELVAGALIHYPLYADPQEGRIITVEEAVDLLERFRNAPPRPHPLLHMRAVMLGWRHRLMRRSGGPETRA